MLAYALVFPFFSFHDARWTTQVIRIGLSLFVIVVCCKRKDRWKGNSLCSAVCVCGENSLAVYVLHGFFTDYQGYLGRIDSVFLAEMASVALAAAVAAVCIVAARIIGTSAWCRKLLFGK